MDIYRLLIVDDDAALTRMLKVILKEKGFDVEIAQNGDEGLRKLKEKKPDVLVLDITMPKKDGWDVLKELAASKEHAAIPVLVMTGRGELKGALEGIRETDFITKPFEIYHFVEKIKVLCRKSTPKRIYVLDSTRGEKQQELISSLEALRVKVVQVNDLQEYESFSIIQAPDLILINANQGESVRKLKTILDADSREKSVARRDLLAYAFSANDFNDAKEKYPELPLFNLEASSQELMSAVKNKIKQE